MQLDFATGYIGMVSDTTQFLGSLLVNTTWGSDTWRQCPEFESQSWSWRHNPSNTLPAQPPEGTPDQPRKRFWFRRFREIYGLLFLAATITGVLANSRYHRAPDDAEIAAWIGRLRYASASVVLFLSIILIGVILYARTLPRVPEHAISRLLAIVSMCIIVAIYRLSIMHNETTSLTSFAPGSQNQTRDKVLFYIFHIFPEWTVEAILWCTNMRQTYQTGYFGDWRWRDETPKEKEKREEKEKKREEKRREREEKRLGKKTKAIGELIEGGRSDITGVQRTNGALSDDAYSLSAGAGDSATANERIV
ncbi:hypothetical protein AX16_008358 [Volvariella volvacea WC 439]|nr:hypothetical protein AX16_008358 [Volvariella volvacea WC 439]